MKKGTVLMVIVLILSSCADLKKSEQLEQIEAMHEKLSEWETQLEAFNETEWQERILTSDSTVEQLKRLEADTIPLDDAVKLDNYRITQVKMKRVPELQIACLGDVKAAKKRLKKLRNDIDTGSGKRHKYDDFLREEEKHIDALESKFAQYDNGFSEVEAQFSDIQNEVNRIISEHLSETAVQ